MERLGGIVDRLIQKHRKKFDPMAIECPWCGAKPEQPCHNVHSGEEMRSPHIERRYHQKVLRTSNFDS